jgi:GTP-binding protein
MRHLRKPDRSGNAADRVRVAIVGRPNVGKSTLFNRLLGRRRAITLDQPGVTRDPIVEPVDWDGVAIDLVDTGGLRGEADIALADRVHEHTVRAIGLSDILVVLFDARAGLNPMDRETVELVTRSGLPAVYVANKGEGRAGEEAALEFCALGIDPPMVISAEHGQNIGQLRGEIEELAEAILADRAADAEEGTVTGEEDDEARDLSDEDDVFDDGSDDEQDFEEDGEDVADRACHVALVGRPNVGKSSFLNLVAGETLSLVDNKPGTTRDVVDIEIVRGGRRYLLLDTAGMRRPSRVEEGVERISVRRSLEAIERADVVVLIVEPEEGVADQDARIARHAWMEGRALVLLVNKADLATEPRLARIEADLRDEYPTLTPVPVARISVKKNRGIDDAFRLIDHAFASHNRRLSTPDVNRAMAETAARREPPVLGRGRVKLFYGTQVAVRPPTIHIFTNRVEIPEEYSRFLERVFRELHDFEGSPLRLRFVRRDSHGQRDPGEAPPKEKTGRDRRGMKSGAPVGGKRDGRPGKGGRPAGSKAAGPKGVKVAGAKPAKPAKPAKKVGGGKPPKRTTTTKGRPPRGAPKNR